MFEYRRFLHPQADIERDADEKYRHEKRYSPAAHRIRFSAKLLGTHCILDNEDHSQRQKQSERSCDLDKRSVKTTLFIRHVFGDIDGGSAVFTTECEALENADEQQDDRCGNAYL